MRNGAGWCRFRLGHHSSGLTEFPGKTIPAPILQVFQCLILGFLHTGLLQQISHSDLPQIRLGKTVYAKVAPQDVLLFLGKPQKLFPQAFHSYHVDHRVFCRSGYQLARPEPDKLLPQVKNIIAVSSGKGGVGKSTVAVVGCPRLGL